MRERFAESTIALRQRRESKDPVGQIIVIGSTHFENDAIELGGRCLEFFGGTIAAERRRARKAGHLIARLVPFVDRIGPGIGIGDELRIGTVIEYLVLRFDYPFTLFTR